jgi:hypothetical protein
MKNYKSSGGMKKTELQEQWRNEEDKKRKHKEDSEHSSSSVGWVGVLEACGLGGFILLDRWLWLVVAGNVSHTTIRRFWFGCAG